MNGGMGDCELWVRLRVSAGGWKRGVRGRGWEQSWEARRHPPAASSHLPHSHVPLVNPLSDFPIWCLVPAQLLPSPFVTCPDPPRRPHLSAGG